MWRSTVVGVLLVGCAHATPPPEDLAGRRAVRGAPLGVAQESEELRALREFEEQSFSRNPDDQAGTPAAAPAWLSALNLPDLPVRLDPRVVRYLEFYKSDPRGRAIMASWLRKQGRWRKLFEDALRRAHLPLGLLYVAMIESGYDPHDRSSAGAVGLWQFMPENSRIYGLRVDYWVDDRKNPLRATAAFTHYASDLKERFGAWPLALAAFNAGYGAVLRSMQKYNTNDYWELCRHEDGLPWETVLYVPKAMAAAIVGENRKLFGYDEVTPEAPFDFDAISVPTSMTTAAIAHAAGTTSLEIETLNPELRRKRTPPSLDGQSWPVRVPKGSAARFFAHLDAEPEAVKPFVLRFGERLDELALRFGASERELRRLNGVEDSSELKPGTILLVPDGRASLAPRRCEPVIVAVPDKDAGVPGRKRLFYRTLAADSIADLATFFHVKASELLKWNHLDPDARLAANLVLQLWVVPEFDTSKAALVDASAVRVVTTGSEEFFDLVEAKRGRARLSYVVRKGDDLKRLGKKYGLSVADLERINRFSADHTQLTVGQKLIVYRPMTPEERSRTPCRLLPAPKSAPALATSKPAIDRGGDEANDRDPRAEAPHALPPPPPPLPPSGGKS